MKKIFAIVISVVLMLSLMPAVALAGNGNGLPSGPHYNLNIIGTNDKTAPMDDNNGHRIFVKLQGNSKIYLTEGDFAVLDANGTDSNGAKFSLPNPDPDQDGETWYSVYCRLRGTPNKEISFQTVAELEGEKYVGMKMVRVREQGNGKNKFENVSKYLLYVAVEIDGVVKYVPIFSPNLEGATWYWDVNNQGCKLVQLRFYEVETDTELPTWPLP